MSIEVEAEARSAVSNCREETPRVEKNTSNWNENGIFGGSLKVNEVVVNQSDCFPIVTESVFAYILMASRVSINATEAFLTVRFFRVWLLHVHQTTVQSIIRPPGRSCSVL